jgi:uncharacterized protein (TIGR02391 family)
VPLLKNSIPDAAALVSMPPGDLAGYILQSLLKLKPADRGMWSRRNFCSSVMREFEVTDQGRNEEVGIACSTAWTWLEANNLLCQNPEQDAGWYTATPRGRQVQDHQQLRALIASEQLPEHVLHQDLLLNVRPLFLQGRFDTAVFEAFKTLEVAIRTTAELGHDLVGVQLASRAFHPDDGPLTDLTRERGERVALMSLMTGAIGSYKNPTSHRKVDISPEEAREMIVVASHLLRIVSGRQKR